MAELILRHKDNIVKVHEHQQMLQNLEDDLSEEDRRLAWEEFQREKEAPSENERPIGPASGLSMLEPPPMTYVAEQLFIQVVQCNTAFWNAGTPEAVRREMIGSYLKKTKLALGKFELVKLIDQKSLAQCIRAAQPPQVTNTFIQRLQRIETKILMLRSELTKVSSLLSHWMNAECWMDRKIITGDTYTDRTSRIYRGIETKSI